MEIGVVCERLGIYDLVREFASDDCRTKGISLKLELTLEGGIITKSVL